MIELDESKRPANMRVVQEEIRQLSLSDTPVLTAQREHILFNEQPVFNQVEEPVRAYRQVVEPVRNQNPQGYEFNGAREIPMQQQSPQQMHFTLPKAIYPFSFRCIIMAP
ncbi:hypothetical protein ccbrp13_61260 [Ktedonobacteria bacterium brp13]|nr:hypothetical protein ccbrp13_61260 [Ktedonobacteria bacterium brp13]